MMKSRLAPSPCRAGPRESGAAHEIGKPLTCILPNAAGAARRAPHDRLGRVVLASFLAALLAACQTTPQPGSVPGGPGSSSRLPPGNSQRDGPEARPPANLESVPDAV